MKRLFIVLTFICIAGLAVYYFYQKNGGIKEIELVKLEKLRFKKVIPFPKLTLIAEGNAVLDNPNPVGVEIIGVDFDVLLQGKHITTVQQKVSIDMPANAEFRLPINFEIPLGKSGFFNDAKDILTGAWKNKSVNIQTTGIIRIKTLQLEFEIPFDEKEDYLLKDYLPK